MICRRTNIPQESVSNATDIVVSVFGYNYLFTNTEALSFLLSFVATVDSRVEVEKL